MKIYLYRIKINYNEIQQSVVSILNKYKNNNEIVNVGNFDKIVKNLLFKAATLKPQINRIQEIVQRSDGGITVEEREILKIWDNFEKILSILIKKIAVGNDKIRNNLKQNRKTYGKI